MPKAIYEFNLPEEQQDFEEFLCAPTYRRAFSEVWEKLRNKVRYEDHLLPKGELAAYQQVYDWIGDLCKEHDLEVP
jgi:hypothetical protein